VAAPLPAVAQGSEAGIVESVNHAASAPAVPPVSPLAHGPGLAPILVDPVVSSKALTSTALSSSGSR